MDDERNPQPIEAVIRMPWADLLAEIKAASDGWLSKLVEGAGRIVREDCLMTDLTLADAARAVSETALYAQSDHAVPAQVRELLDRAAVLLAQADDLTEGKPIEPVPLAHAAHALACSAVLALREARTAWKEDRELPGTSFLESSRFDIDDFLANLPPIHPAPRPGPLRAFLDRRR